MRRALPARAFNLRCGFSGPLRDLDQLRHAIKHACLQKCMSKGDLSRHPARSP